MLIDQLADVEEPPRALASRIFEPRRAFARGGDFTHLPYMANGVKFRYAQ